MLCHTDPEGGENKLNSFAGVGLILKDGAIDGKSTDTDGDGKMDADELVAGENPATYGAVSVCTPEYGCGARVAKAPAHGALQSESLLLAALGFGVLLRWQLRRRADDRR
jgi:hypothetical protein